jgi:hypothetical protein
MRIDRSVRPLPFAAILLLTAGLLNRAYAVDSPEPVSRLAETIPRQATDFTAPRVGQLLERAGALHEWMVTESLKPWTEDHAIALGRVETLTAAKLRVDTLFQQMLAARGQFAALPKGEPRREHARQFLRASSAMIELSGRMRYTLRDAIDAAAYATETDDASLAELVEILKAQRSSIGVAVMIYLLDDPVDPAIAPVPTAIKRNLLEAIRLTRQSDLLPQLALVFLSGRAEPSLRLDLAQTIRELGLPQNIRPGQDPTLPPPAITAEQLHDRLSRVDRGKLAAAERAQLDELLRWSKGRAERGIESESIRVAGFDLQEGDWLLMRNPSPYNHFTDLAPGLFTHVGVVTVEVNPDGHRRFVIVEMPEQSSQIPATNVDTYLQRTLHYFFLRHEDADVRQTMSSAAASMIGNESRFDLQFRTDRVLELAGVPLAERPIHTYCAGFLLLCALQTEQPREAFFPLAEHAPNENCQQNLAKLGLAIGDDFISPTGALFSPRMTIVARRRPMYEPTREVKEAVYDHFAQRMIHDRLTPSPSAYQALREKLAGLSKQNAWLARALARANNVSEQMDLESAAKAAAVVETLDEIADSAMNEFIAARGALLAGQVELLREQGYSPEQIEHVEAYRERHPQLWNAWIERRLSPRDLRVKLVDYYVDQGKQRLDQRFFRSEAVNE